jgi:hypothetical protein
MPRKNARPQARKFAARRKAAETGNRRREPIPWPEVSSIMGVELMLAAKRLLREEPRDG